MIYSDEINRKAAIWLGHLVFGTLLVMAAFYCRERIIHADSAFYLFNVLYDDGFFIAHNRGITYFSQWVPLLLYRAGANLPTIVMGYSLALMAVNYLFFLLIVYRLKNPAAGLVLALSMVIANRYKFYTGISEIFVSISLISLVVAWWTRPKALILQATARNNLLGGIGVIGLSYLGHPFLFIPLIIVWAALLFTERKWRDGQHWLAFMLILIVAYFRYQAISGNYYESNRLESIGEGIQFLTKFRDYYVWEVAKMYLREEYLMPLVLFLVTLIGMMRQKKILGAIFLLVSWFLAFVLVLVLHAYLNGPYYNLLDGYFGILGIVWALPIVNWLMKKASVLKMGVMGLLIVFSIIRIQDKAAFFTERRQHLESELASQEQQKVLKSIYHFDWNTYWNPWAIPFESLLLSAMQHPEGAKTVYYGDAGQLQDRLNRKDLFLADRHQYLPSRFPKHLFVLPPELYSVVEPGN